MQKEMSPIELQTITATRTEKNQRKPGTHFVVRKKQMEIAGIFQGAKKKVNGN